MRSIYLHKIADYYANEFDTRCPFELLDAIGAITMFDYDFSPKGLKGLATYMNNFPYAVINGNLSKIKQRLVAGHEAGHLILHKPEILQLGAFKDYRVYGDTSKLEYEADIFMVNFLISDKDVLDAIANDHDGNFFTTAAELFMPHQLLAYKLHNMTQRGHHVKSPIDLDMKFFQKLT